MGLDPRLEASEVRVEVVVRHARLGDAGLEWPSPTPDHPGTPILHVGRTTRGLARFTPVSHQAPAEVPDAEYPLVLTTGARA